MPAQPMATSVRPRRHVRPNVSDTMTATSTPARARTPSRMRRAERSGSTGSRAAQPSSTLERSTPALAHTKPWAVSVITRSPRRRSTRTVSASTTAWWPRGSSGSMRDQPVLGLRHDLLRDDDARRRRAGRRARPGRRRRSSRRGRRPDGSRRCPRPRRSRAAPSRRLDDRRDRVEHGVGELGGDPRRGHHRGGDDAAQAARPRPPARAPRRPRRSPAWTPAVRRARPRRRPSACGRAR